MGIEEIGWRGGNIEGCLGGWKVGLRGLEVGSSQGVEGERGVSGLGMRVLFMEMDIWIL